MYQDSTLPYTIHELVGHNGFGSKTTMNGPFSQEMADEHMQQEFEQDTEPTEAEQHSMRDGYLLLLYTHQQIAQEHAYLLALQHLSQEVHQSLDVEQVLHNALQRVIGIFGAQTGCFVLLNEQHKLVRWISSTEQIQVNEAIIQKALHEGVQGQVLHDQHPRCVEDNRDEAWYPLIPGRSLLVAPLSTAAGLVGVLTLSHEAPATFNSQQEKHFMTAVEIIGTALQQAWLFDHAKRKMSDRERMVSMVVHDIRSPLMATSACFDIIQRAFKEHPLSEEIQGFVQDSIASGKRGLQEVIDLTNDLLDIKKLQSGHEAVEYQPIMLELLYDEIHNLMYNLAVQHQVIVRYHVHPRSLRLMADTRLIRRALVNLVVNALRFTPKGGTVTLGAYAFPDKKGIILFVEDMGPGVPSEDKERIFQPFVQGKGESVRGTGLGLAFCYEVAHSHGGRIWVEDRQGGGSRFCVQIPMSV